MAQDPFLGGFEAAYVDQARQAQTRLTNLQANKLAGEVADEQLLQTLSTGQAIARNRAAQGQVATLEDLEKPKSRAEPLEQLLTIANKAGLSPLKTAGLAKTAAEIRKEEAIAAHRTAQAETAQIDTQLKGAQVLSDFASAALQSPAQYDQLRLQAAQRGLPVQQLPAQFNAGALTILRDSGIKAIDTLRLQRDKANDKAQEPLRKAQIAQAEQTVRTGKAREALLKERHKILTKYEGTGGKPVTEAQKILNAQRKANLAAKSLKDNPAPPADINDPLYTVGQTFTIKGQIYQMVGRDEKGVPMVVPASVAAIPEIAQTSDELTDEEILNEE